MMCVPTPAFKRQKLLRRSAGVDSLHKAIEVIAAAVSAKPPYLVGLPR